MKKREAIASIGITNTTALLILDIDEMDGSLTYYISVVDDEKIPKSHHAKINYTVKNNDAYFNSILGRMHLSQAMRVPLV